MPSLDHRTKIYAVQDCAISQLISDPGSGLIPSAPSTPATPTVSAAGGAATVSYTAIASNGVDSAASAAGTSATAIATTPTAANPATITVAAVPAGQVYIIQRTSGSNTGVIGRLTAGQTQLIDTGLPATAYVANTSGILYGAKIDVPGIKHIAVTGTVTNVELRGDFQLLDSDAVLKMIKVAWSQAKLSLDAIGVMMGGTTADTGVAPNRVSDFSYTKTAKFNYFKLEGQAVGADPIAGDFHLVFWRCKLDAFPTFGMAEENYEVMTGSANAVPRLTDGAWFDAILNETAVAIA